MAFKKASDSGLNCPKFYVVFGPIPGGLGTDFTEADQLFFDQISASAEGNEKIVEAAKANNLPNFSAFLERTLDELFIDRMENNEEIFSRVMTDKAFRSAAHEHLAEEIFKRVREEK